MRFPEQCSSIEEGLFVGMVGVMFENELDDSPPIYPVSFYIVGMYKLIDSVCNPLRQYLVDSRSSSRSS